MPPRPAQLLPLNSRIRCTRTPGRTSRSTAQAPPPHPPLPPYPPRLSPSSSAARLPWAPGIVMEIGVYLAIHVGCHRVTFIGWDVTSDYSHFWDSRQKTGLSVSPETFIPLTAGGAYGASARDLLDEFALVREESRCRPKHLASATPPPPPWAAAAAAAAAALPATIAHVAQGDAPVDAVSRRRRCGRVAGRWVDNRPHYSPCRFVRAVVRCR